MAGVFANETKIYLLASGVSGSTATIADAIVGEINSVNVTGGNQENDVKHNIGGDIEIEKNPTPIEVSMDISLLNTTGVTLDRWDKLKYPNGLSTDESPIKSMWLTHYTNSLLKVRGYNNIRVTALDTKVTAEDEVQMSVTFKCAAKTDLGVSNVRTSTISGSTIVANANSFLNWA